MRLRVLNRRKVLLVLAALSLATTVQAAPSAPSAAAAVTGRAAAAATAVPGRAAGAVVEDITIRVPGRFDPISAYLVRPAGPVRGHSQAGILFLHWLGDLNSDRGEFLPEAIALAKQGSVALLPAGTFPWTGVGGPDGTAADVAAVRDQQAAFQGALDYLAARPEVDSGRLGLVGHDYGAMFGSLLVDQDPRIKAAVLATPDATWGDWFVKYFGLGLSGPAADAYSARFAALDPARHLGRLGDALLLQFADEDVYIDATRRAAVTAGAPAAKVVLYDARHQLTDQARADRDAFLAARLGLVGVG